MKLKCILVVEDDPDTLDILLALLAQETGFRTVGASNGSRAIEILKQFTPHIMILDIVMPEVDGFQVIRFVRDTLKNKDLPIIVNSAVDFRAQPHDESTSILLKPNSLDAVVSTIHLMAHEKYLRMLAIHQAMLDFSKSK